MTPVRPEDITLELRHLDIAFGRRPPPGAEEAEGERPFRLCVERFTARGGQLIGIAGRSGEGKSTLLHVTALLLPAPDYTADGQPFRLAGGYTDESGQAVEFAFGPARGADTPAPPRTAELVRNEAFGFIFQQAFMLPYFNVIDNLSLPHMVRTGFNAEVARRRAEQYLREFQLPSKHWNSFPSELSGGQNQRLAVGRAMIHRPAFLFADEPTANLDNRLRSMVLARLRAYADSGRAVILVSHELGDLARHCDRILVVQNGRLRFPFTGDPDDPETTTDNTLDTRPSLPPVAQRDDAALRAINAELTSYIWERPHAGAATGTTRESSPRESSHDTNKLTMSEPPASQTGGRLGLRGRVWRYALTEILSRKGGILRATVASILCLATCGFTFLSSLAGGAVDFLRDTTLGPDEFINRLAASKSGGFDGGVFTPEEVAYLREKVPGLKPGLDGQPQSPTLMQEVLLRYDDANGNYDDKYVYSVPVGDVMLRPVSDAEFPTAQTGVRYLSGGPFRAENNDAAGVLVSRTWLRRDYWRMDEWDNPRVPDPQPKFPEFLVFRLDSDAGWNERPYRPRLPGLDGRVRVPVLGVFEYPPQVLREDPSARGVFLPEGFLRRLASDRNRWQSYYPLMYPAGRVGSASLVSPYNVVTGLTIRVANPSKNPMWAESPVVRERLQEAFGAINPARDTRGGLVVKLNPELNISQRLTREQFEQHEWRTIRVRGEEQVGIYETIREEAGGEPVLEYTEEPVRNKFPPVCPLEDCPPRYTFAVLRFSDMRFVLPAQTAIRTELPNVRAEVRYDRAIQIFQDVDSLVANSTFALTLSFTLGLLFLVGITAYMHVAGKSADIGILRAYGLTALSLAWVYMVELALFMLPACAAGIGLALLASSLTNDFVAERLMRLSVGEEKSDRTRAAAKPDPTKMDAPAKSPSGLDARPVPDAPASNTANKPPVFRNLRQPVAETLMQSGWTLLWVAGMLIPASLIPVYVIRRQSIVDCLRGAGG